MSTGLERARGLAEAAFRDHAKSILSFCRRRVSEPAAAEDIAQETFARYWASLAAGKEIENPRAFLYAIAGNLIKNHIRDRKPTSSLESLLEDGFEPGDPSQDTSAEARQAEMRGQVERILGAEDATILALRFVEGLPLADVARAVGLTRIAVSVRIHRAMKKLRPHFHED